MDGVLNIDKPAGPTSHDVVDRVRQIVGQRRVGHAGTLDPFASGVLVVCLGKGTRIVEYLMSSWKEYRAELVLGVETDTGDVTGRVIAQHDASGVSVHDFENAAAAFIGEIEQIPPLYSAVKHNGTRLYKLAREGRPVQPLPRKVTVYSIDLISFDDAQADESGCYTRRVVIVIRCSSGTYVRSLAADIGRKLGCGAYVSELRRTAVGKFRIDWAVTLDELELAKRENRLEDLIIDLNRALELAEIPSVSVGPDDFDAAINGRSVRCSFKGAHGSVVRILAPHGSLIGVGKTVCSNGKVFVHPEKVLYTEDGQH